MKDHFTQTYVIANLLFKQCFFETKYIHFGKLCHYEQIKSIVRIGLHNVIKGKY
jgi:hypothetical protein